MIVVTPETRILLEQTLQRSLDDSRKRVNAFVANHFGVRGCFSRQKLCLMPDLLRNPVNALVSVPCLTVKRAFLWLERLGWEKAERLNPWIPVSIKTAYQRSVEKLIRSELLDDSADGSLLGPLREHPQAAPLAPRIERIVRRKISEELADYAHSRASTSELMGSLVTLGASYLFFNDAALSAGEIGSRLAGEYAHEDAASGFFLGKEIGTAFYGAFPVNPTQEQVLLATLLVMAVLAVIALLVNFLSDPFQNRLGVHQRQLHRMLDSLEAKLLIELRREFR